MLSTIYIKCTSCKSRDWHENRFVRPNIENATSARASSIFWSIFVTLKKSITYSTEKVLGVTSCCLLSTRNLVKNAHRDSKS